MLARPSILCGTQNAPLDVLEANFLAFKYYAEDPADSALEFQNPVLDSDWELAWALDSRRDAYFYTINSTRIGCVVARCREMRLSSDFFAGIYSAQWTTSNFIRHRVIFSPGRYHITAPRKSNTDALTLI